MFAVEMSNSLNDLRVLGTFRALDVLGDSPYFEC